MGSPLLVQVPRPLYWTPPDYSAISLVHFVAIRGLAPGGI